jgi:hypothetical protein
MLVHNALRGKFSPSVVQRVGLMMRKRMIRAKMMRERMIRAKSPV